MNGVLKPGDEVSTNKVPAKVLELIGEGGQGYVYRVEFQGGERALKYYKPGGMGENPELFKKNIIKNVNNKNPDPDVFLWPEAYVTSNDGFGYIMPLREQGYFEVSEFLLTKVRFKSYQRVVDAALNIVNAFRSLHNKGYCYQDLNDGNFFINPNNGKVLICDNDNVATEGEQTGIIGKPGYIAPEIIKGQLDGNIKLPDTYSDRLSMAIIIFMICCLTRPMEGRRSFENPRDEKLVNKMYGEDVHFIMEDINHPQYGPSPYVQKNAFKFWEFLPEYMKIMFMEALGQKALNTPQLRPAEVDWIKALVRFRSDIVSCNCGVAVLTKDGKSDVCSKCNQRLDFNHRLFFSNANYAIPGVKGSRIYKCQVMIGCNADEALDPVGIVKADNDNISILRIKNLTEKFWDAKTPSGKERKVMPEEMVPLKDGIKLMIESETIIIQTADEIAE